MLVSKYNIPFRSAHKIVGAIVKKLVVANQTFKDATPELVQKAWDYFRNEQLKGTAYTPLIGEGDKPATWLNERVMQQVRPELRKYYYDPTKYKTYLEQLGIVRAAGQVGVVVAEVV
jgi:aminobenzoyl-glutamate utilization protein B